MSQQYVTASGATAQYVELNSNAVPVSSIGTINSQSKSANGAVIVAPSLYMQTADASFPGLVSTGVQTFAGNKTFTGTITVSHISMTSNDLISGVGAIGTNRVIGMGLSNTSGQLVLGIESSTGGSMFTGGLAYATVLGTGTAEPLQLATNNNVRLTISSAGNSVFTGTLAASNLSGTNTGDVTIGTANGLSLAGQVLSLALSSTATTGALSAADWNTFNGKQPAGSYITALTGDVTASGPGSAAATVAQIQGTVVNGTTGSNKIVFSASPTLTGILTVPTIDAGAATALILKSNSTTALTISTSQDLTQAGNTYTISSGTSTGNVKHGSTAGILILDGDSGGAGAALSLYGSTQASFASNLVAAASTYLLKNLGGSTLLSISSAGASTLAGSLDVSGTASQIAVGAALSATSKVLVSGTDSAITGTTTQGFKSSFTSNSNNTATIMGYSAQLNSAASTSVGSFRSFYGDNPVVGAGGSVPTYTGFIDIGAKGHPTTNTAAFADNESYSGNFFLNQSGDDPSVLGGPITAFNLSGTNTGDVTIGTANGLSRAGQVLSLALSSTSTTGALSNTDWNTFNAKATNVGASTLEEIWVAVYGSDVTGDGSPSNPYKTVVHAIAAVGATDQDHHYAIYIGPGRFIETSDIVLPPYVDLIGDSHRTTYVRVNGGTNTVKPSAAWATGTSWCTLKSIYFGGSTIINFDLQALGGSNANIVFQDIWANTTFTVKGRNAGGGDFIEAYDTFLLGNVTLDQTYVQWQGGVFAGTLAINSTLATISGTYVNCNFNGNVTINGTNASTQQFAASPFAASGITLTTTGTVSLIVDSLSVPPVSQQTLSGGTSVTYLDNATTLKYVPTTSGNWNSAPTQVSQALDNVALASNTSSATKTGVLSSADWSTFNAKQPAGNYITALTGDVTASGPGSSAATVAKIQSTVVSGTTGSNNVVFSTSPVLVTPNLGTPTTLVGTNITGTASGLTAGTVTTNANLTGPITSSGNATSIASKTGTGTTFVVSASPTITGTLTVPNISMTGDSLIDGAPAVSTNRVLAFNINNLSGQAILALESSTGGNVFTGTSAYAAVFGTGNAQALQLATNNNVRFTISSAGVVNVPNLTASLPVQTDSSKNLVSSAIDLSGTQATGTLAAGRFPALTGDVTTSAGSVATTVAKIAGTTVSGTTGSTNAVFSNSPTLVTPVLGAATATTINKVTITAPASSATLTIQDGTTLAYEEGTWSAAFAATTGTISGTATGVYTKVGRVVTVSVLISSTAISSPTGAVTITGLPWAMNSSTRFAFSVAATGFAATATTSIVAYGLGGQSFVFLKKYAAGVISDLATDFTNNVDVHLTGTYQN